MTCSSLWKRRTILGKPKHLAAVIAIQPDVIDIIPPVYQPSSSSSSPSNIFTEDWWKGTWQKWSSRERDPRDEWTTSTTTVFTPGNNQMDEAMHVKMVADELLAATGTVVGTTLAFTVFPNFISVKSGAQFGEDVGRGLGDWMWWSLQ